MRLLQPIYYPCNSTKIRAQTPEYDEHITYLNVRHPIQHKSVSITAGLENDDIHSYSKVITLRRLKDDT